MLLQRPGFTLPKSGCEKDYINSCMVEDIALLTDMASGNIYLSDLEKIDISSTEIRRTIADGEQPKYVIPGNVWNYIKHNKLYKQ